MANLLVRNVDETLVQSLREQAAAHGHSAEAEHREILTDALRKPKRRSFAEALMRMPSVGEDADFSRIEDTKAAMYLIDTNVISELRKQERANPGVSAFFRQVAREKHDLYLSVVTVGELRRGVELIRHRGDLQQATLLEKWLETILRDYAKNILPVDEEIAQLWGHMRAPHAENALDKLIAATALIHDLTVVTRNVGDFTQTGAQLLDPFA